jgi:Flp pilus assembly protein TadD
VLTKLDKLTPYGASFVIAGIGVAVYFSGLGTPFQGDDLPQIVNSVPAHSVSNFFHFFQGGSFYYGQGPSTLSGGYYKPLMITTYSILYSLFGPNPFPFHVMQLALHIGSVILLYQVFRHVFRPSLALFLSLIFLVHPINSQTVFAIASLQDTLFFFFGILALFIVLRSHSVASLLLAACSLFLSLLSKETGILFVPIVLLYLLWFDRRRLYPFLGIIAAPLIAYLFLRFSAVGFHNPENAPIDSVDLVGRLFNVPSECLFYINRFLFPVNLASAYYWVHTNFSFVDFLIPLAIDLAVITLFSYVGLKIRKRGTTHQHHYYLFFAAWTVLGLIAHLQLIPLDMTASETWFYFPMAGVLGMIGVAATVLGSSMSLHVNVRAVMIVASALLLLLGVRTAVRGTDWNDAYTLAVHDIAVSPEDFSAENTIAYHLYNQGDLAGARAHAYHAVSIYSTLFTENTLGQILLASGDYAQAHAAFDAALSHQEIYYVYENLAAVTAWYGDPVSNKAFLVSALQKYPQDGVIWFYLAILEQRNGNNAYAKVAITNAESLGVGTPYYYNNIMNNRPLVLPARPQLGLQS